MQYSELDCTLLALLTVPMSLEEIGASCPETDQKLLHNSLNRLMQDGQVMKNKKKRYARSAHYSCLTGKFLATERGFAFVAPEEKDENGDLFIPPNAGGGAWHGDRVLARVSERKNGRGRREGMVMRVLERAGGELTGALVRRGRDYFVMPSSKKYPEISVRQQDLGAAEVGDRVAVEVSDYGNGAILPQGRISATLGENGTMEASIAGILRENGVYEDFPADVLAQADAAPQQVAPEDIEGRLDLREQLIFTIDGDDAKDFDDAVSLQVLENGRLLLGVHIADVSHYVRPVSPLDDEALRRGTSVYYPGHVVPMLPFALSHGICSLNPDVDRLAFSALMEFDKDGRRHESRFAKTVIRSKARMTYKNVNTILDSDKELCEKYGFLRDTAEKMNALAHTLFSRRIERGALELDIPEATIVLGEDGRPVDVQYRERGESERLIEEFMLQANEAVAEHMVRRERPSVYRVHENPDPEKLRVFAEFARPFGYRVNPLKPEDTAQLQAVLKGAKGDPAQRILPTLLLRSLARARYAEECIGHYGLKAKFYLHFTSPIRRYPDLMAHRMLQKSLLDEPVTNADQAACEQASAQSTAREMAADICERDIDKLFFAAYMHPFIGQEFDGEVSGVQTFGLFIALNNGCEGLIRTELLGGDYYVYDEQHMTLQGRTTGKRFAIGSALRVRLLAASEVTGQIDFAPAEGALPVAPGSARRPMPPRAKTQAAGQKPPAAGVKHHRGPRKRR